MWLSEITRALLALVFSCIISNKLVKLLIKSIKIIDPKKLKVKLIKLTWKEFLSLIQEIIIPNIVVPMFAPSINAIPHLIEM